MGIYGTCTVYINILPFLCGSLNEALYGERESVILQINFLVGPFLSAIYASLCLSFAGDRFCAVYFPISYKIRRPKLMVGMISASVAFSICFAADISLNIAWVPILWKSVLHFGSMVIIMLAITVFYLAIICKLWGMRPASSNRVVPATNMQMENRSVLHNTLV